MRSMLIVHDAIGYTRVTRVGYTRMVIWHDFIYATAMLERPTLKLLLWRFLRLFSLCLYVGYDTVKHA